jgi:hypothetical protein
MTPDGLVKAMDGLLDAGRLRASDLGARAAMDGVRVRGHRIAGTQSTFRVTGPHAGEVAKAVSLRVGAAAQASLLKELG